MEKKIFLAKDLDFTGCDYKEIKLICDEKLPLISYYPKLVSELYLNNNFREWLKQKKLKFSNEKTIINKIGKAIKRRTTNGDGELIVNKIDLMDDKLWEILIDEFMHDIIKSEISKENNVNKDIIKEFNKYKKNMSYKCKPKVRNKTKKNF